MQPGNLGGGKCGGCKVLMYFQALGLCDDPFSLYEFFSDKQLLEATSHEHFFLSNLCKNPNSGCYQTYSRIVQEGYLTHLDRQDEIHVTYENGQYKADEGKHRICAMKRFGYNSAVPMVVHRIGGPICANTEDAPWLLQFKRYTPDIVEHVYQRYERLGISKTAVRELLKDPAATVLDYLSKSPYSYTELLDVVYDTYD